MHSHSAIFRVHQAMSGDPFLYVLQALKRATNNPGMDGMMLKMKIRELVDEMESTDLRTKDGRAIRPRWKSLRRA